MVCSTARNAGSNVASGDPGRAAQLLEAARRWLDLGVSVVPGQPRSKEVLFKWGQFQDQLPAFDQVTSWFRSGVMNLVVVCGSGGLAVLDFDKLDDFNLFRRDNRELATTYQEATSRGIHCFYWTDYPISLAKKGEGAGAELLGRGHLVHVAPSIHPSGAVYYPVGDPLQPILRIDINELIKLLSRDQLVEGSQVHQEAPRAPLLNKVDKYPVDLIRRIKAAFPVLAMADDLVRDKYPGRPMRPGHVSKGYWWGWCPLHEDKHHSFWVFPARGLWGCFACNLKGDVINLYALAHGLTVNQAIKELAGRLPK
jgi:hypothetical protein